MAGEWTQLIASRSTNTIPSRDILEYYFNGCPWCGYDTEMCPGCGGVSQNWPEIFATCGRDQACPVFMGLTFAEEDKECVDALDWMEWDGKLPRRLVGKALDLMTHRFHRIQARHEEMGHWGHESAEERLESWKAVYLSDDNVVD